MVFAFLILIFTCTGQMQEMLDSMAYLTTGGSTFDRKYLSQLESCLSLQPNLLQSQNKAWGQFINYFLSNGTTGDRWGNCIKIKNQTECHDYHELNATALNVDGIIIYEPCNYVSNVAYYHISTQMCDQKTWNFEESTVEAMIQGFSALAYGSAFWHGSRTKLGNLCDNRFIDFVAFLGYQASVVPYPNSSILHDISLTPRKKDAVYWVNELTRTFLEDDIGVWSEQIGSYDIPQYYLTFSAIFSNLFALVFSPSTVETIVNELTSAFNLPPEDVEFVNKHYLPAVFNVTADIKLSQLQKAQLLSKLAGTIVKLGYAFAWQEWVFPSPWLLRPGVNALGAELLPSVNRIADFLTGFPRTDPAMIHSKNVYPGDERCRKQQPHSKWHEESANGLLDLMYLLNFQRGLIDPKLQTPSQLEVWLNAVKEFML